MTAPAHAYSAEAGVRRYQVEGLDFDPISVTSLLKVIAPAPGLAKWLDKKIANKAIEVYQDTQEPELALQRGISARWDTTTAGDLGTAVHYATEVSDLQLMGRDVEPEVVVDEKKVRQFLNQWIKAREEHGMEILSTEVTLVNPEMGYAGTADRIVIIPALSELPLVLDIKSGEKLFPDVALQCAALSRCTHLLHNDGQMVEIPWELHQDIGIAAHLRPRSCKLIPLDIGVAWKYFEPLPMLALWRADKVEVMGDRLTPDEETALRAQLRYRLKSLPPDINKSFREQVKANEKLAGGTTASWDTSQLLIVDGLLEKYEDEARERRQRLLDKIGSNSDLFAIRLFIMNMTEGRTKHIDEMTAEEADRFLESYVGHDSSSE